MRLTGTTPQTASFSTTGTARMQLGLSPDPRALSCREHPGCAHAKQALRRAHQGCRPSGSCGSARSLKNLPCLLWGVVAPAALGGSSACGHSPWELRAVHPNSSQLTVGGRFQLQERG